MKSMYQPGGTSPGSRGTLTVNEQKPRPRRIGRSTRRCSVSQEWVTAMGLMSWTQRMASACSVWISNA
jgi:hypothetical protein